MKYYLDTEFNGLGGDLISLALVGDNDKELYLSLTSCLHKEADSWVAENVLKVLNIPSAKANFIHPINIGNYIANFLKGDTNPIIIADWPDDIAYFCKALLTGPGQMVDIKKLKFGLIRIDAYPTTLPNAVQHNALWDARALRHKCEDDNETL